MLPRDLQAADFKQQEIRLLAELAELPLHRIDSWNYWQKMTWLKCMLTKHLPQPKPEDAEKRVQRLKGVEEAIDSEPNATLDTCVELLATEFDRSLGRLLLEELRLWRCVASSSSGSQPATDLSPSEQPISSFSHEPPVAPGDHLWEHILRLLMTRHPSVEWLNPEQGLFRFVDSSGAARSWGRTKGNEAMNYEKMSRSVRQYYRADGGGVITKDRRLKKLQYRFNMKHVEVLQFLRVNFQVEAAAGIAQWLQHELAT